MRIHPDGVTLRELALEQPQRERVLDQALERPLERPRAVGRIPARLSDKLLRSRSELDREPPLREPLVESMELKLDDLAELVPRERLELTEIVELQLHRLNERLAQRGLAIELTPAAKELLAEAGWDPAYGARPLKRALQRLVENPLALRLLEGEFAEGDTVRVDAHEGELVFEKAAAPEKAAA